MPTRIFPTTEKARNQIIKAIEDNKELYWSRPRRDTLQLRVVTFTYENGHFRSRALWIFEPLNHVTDIHEAKRLDACVRELYPEELRHTALNDLGQILRAFWNDGNIKHAYCKNCRNLIYLSGGGNWNHYEGTDVSMTPDMEICPKCEPLITV